MLKINEFHGVKGVFFNVVTKESSWVYQRYGKEWSSLIKNCCFIVK